MAGSTCGSLFDCVSQFQTLITGIFAAIVAGLTAYAIYKAANLPVEAGRRREERGENRRLKLRSLELSGDLKILAMRARQGIGTVKVHKSANASVTEDTRCKMTLTVPQSTQEWEFMSLLPETISRRCIQLNGMIEDHNFDMERAGGAFGDDNFGRSITSRLDTIAKTASELSQAFSGYGASQAT
jgi:hypothetical protein